VNAVSTRIVPRLSEVVAAIGFAWALLGQAPHWIQLLGGALILGGVLVVQPGEATMAAPEPERL